MDREKMQKLYMRVCRDSGFRMDPIQAAHLVAGMLKTSALLVWVEMGIDLGNMERIADGTHPALTNPRYA